MVHGCGGIMAMIFTRAKRRLFSDTPRSSSAQRLIFAHFSVFAAIHKARVMLHLFASIFALAVFY